MTFVARYLQRNVDNLVDIAQQKMPVQIYFAKLGCHEPNGEHEISFSYFQQLHYKFARWKYWEFVKQMKPFGRRFRDAFAVLHNIN